MQNAVIVKGRLIGPRSVELDEPITSLTTEVEVLIRPVPGVQIDQAQSLSVFLRGLPAGKKSKDEIDAQIRSERSEWGDR